MKLGKTGYAWTVSQSLKAVARAGRLVMDVPTDLPDGEVVEMRVVGADVDFAEEWMGPEEAQAFNTEMRASLAEADAGLGVDGDTLIAELRAQLA